MSHAQPYVRVAHTRIVVVTPLLKAAFYEPCTAIRLRCSYQTALHKGVTTALRANAVFVYHTHTHAHTPTHTFPLYCILGTISPIEPKFWMHMECDQTIKSHKNINLIWGHLGYANEGQRSNLPLFCISVTLGPIEPRFCVHMECDQANICHNNIKLIWGHLGYANEGQRSNLPLFCISETVGLIEPKFCMRMECDQTIKSHKKHQLDMTPSWLCKWRSKVKSSFVLYLAYRWSIFSQILICCSWDNSLQDIWHLFFILMTSSQWNFLSQELLVRLSPNFVCTWSVIRQLFHQITPTY